jgi:hypothetical protein
LGVSLAQWHEVKGYSSNLDISKKRKCSMKMAMENDFWVIQNNTQQNRAVEHIIQSTKLWEMLSTI